MLTDPVTDKPLAHTAYHLIFKNRHIVRAAHSITVIDDRIAQGVTDGAGRTGTVYLDAPDKGDHTLLARRGNGKYGSYFALVFAAGPGMALRDWYEIRGCTPSDVYRGFSNKQGLTVYFTSTAPCKIQLRVGHEYQPSSTSTKNSKERDTHHAL